MLKLVLSNDNRGADRMRLSARVSVSCAPFAANASCRPLVRTAVTARECQHAVLSSLNLRAILHDVIGDLILQASAGKPASLTISELSTRELAGHLCIPILAGVAHFIILHLMDSTVGNPSHAVMCAGTSLVLRDAPYSHRTVFSPYRFCLAPATLDDRSDSEKCEPAIRNILACTEHISDQTRPSDAFSPVRSRSTQYQVLPSQ
ncbi:hypothetical protein NM688_g7630 [Phlebia brevispora]|uniref:Uncharacterized protein n=1 Tax=Phlebia brevispora TaxID=194682 RepID=A0ACC1S313_9APHY|nr:hypothetical protein NM688_g7630 [Phlebia brevispora]